MNIALVEDDSKYNNIKIEDCKLFNPGIGGGTYQFINLFYVLSLVKGYNIFFLHRNKSNFTDLPLEKNLIYENEEKLFEILLSLNLDNIILPQRFGYDLLDRFAFLNVPITYRCGNYLNSTEVKYLSLDIVKNVVCLNWEHASKCYDTLIYKKISIIPNYINFDILNMYQFDNTFVNLQDKFQITYIGSITPSKGLHLIAEVWKEIIKKIPNAQLNVIGSKSLYDHTLDRQSTKSTDSYEIRVKSLFEKDPFSAGKVVYFGNLGIEKYEIISKSNLGLVNPSAKSEIFTNSVIDFSLFNVPVLGRNKYGLVSMIEDGENGFKFNNLRDLVKKVIYVYDHKELDFNGRDFIEKKFGGINSVFNWQLLFNENYNNDYLVSNYKPKLKDILHNYFFLRVLSRKFKFFFPTFPAVVEIEFFMKKIYRKLKKI